jgi:predicted permease
MTLWRRLFLRNRIERELDKELLFHLDQQVKDYVRSGMSEAEARRRVSMNFGTLDEVKEECRDVRPGQWAEIVWKDVRYGLRALRSTPMFTLTVVLSLALGIGANTTVFTLMHVALWKPLPVEAPEQIFQLQRSDPDQSYSYYLFQNLSDAASPFGELAATANAAPKRFGLTIDSSERVTGEAVSATFFRMLKVSSAAGRVFEPQDDNILGGNRVAVLNYAFWRSRFQADPSALGKSIYYGDKPYVIVGVAQSGFVGVQPGVSVDVWVPVTADLPANDLQAAGSSGLSVLARMNSVVNTGSAQAAWTAGLQRYIQEVRLPRLVPGDSVGKTRLESDRISLRPAGAGLAGIGKQYQEPLTLLMSVVGLVLLISCANVANLVLARNSARRQEIAVRLALGASRMRVASQLMIESLLIALGGLAAGIVLENFAARGLIAMLPMSRPPIVLDPRPDGAVLVFAIAATMATTILFGLLPAIRVIRRIADKDFTSGSRVSGQSLTGRILVMGQLSLSLLLLIGAGLFLGTIRNLKATELGFRPQRVVSFDVTFPRDTPPDRVKQGYQQIRENLQTASGVIAATFVWPSVYDSGYWSTGIEVEGRPVPVGTYTDFACSVSVGPRFFETIGIGLIAGRYLDERDQDGASPVTVINESLAHAYFQGVSPLGRHITQPGNPPQTREIVGVVRDAKHKGVRQDVCSTEYLPAAGAQNAYGSQGYGSFLLLTRSGVQTFSGNIRAAVEATGGGAQIEQIQPLETIVDSMVNQEHMVAILSSAFGGLAVVLAMIGLYGLMAYGVSQRTAELGIRMALGARPNDVQWLVLKETAYLVVIGIAAGVAAALWLTRFVSNLLYGVQPTDAGVFIASTLLLVVVAALAGYLPARRASRIDPMIALRHE